MGIQKTNVMRILEQKKVAYTAHSYEHEEGVAVEGVRVAEMLGQDAARVFKTLVAQGASRAYYVFAIPAPASLDLKKAARAVGEKSVAMLPVRDLLAVTGYVRGGCSPVGMKKQFQTVFHESAAEYPTIMVSAGKIGAQVELAPEALFALTHGKCADITED